jgi:hypothetical protein
MDRVNPLNLPIPAGTVLKSTDGDILLVGDDIYLYKQIVGSTIYLLNNTRPDIAYAVGQLARFMSVPAVTYLQIANQLLRYLAGRLTLESLTRIDEANYLIRIVFILTLHGVRNRIGYPSMDT